ncbi:apical endosomal glycoprotein-like [Amblyomma americanum]
MSPPTQSANDARATVNEMPGALPANARWASIAVKSAIFFVTARTTVSVFVALPSAYHNHASANIHSFLYGFAYVDMTVGATNNSSRDRAQREKMTRLLSPLFDVANSDTHLAFRYIRWGPDIKTASLSVRCYIIDEPAKSRQYSTELAEALHWTTLNIPLKPGKHCQLVVQVTPGDGTNGGVAIDEVAVITSGQGNQERPAPASATYCNFEEGTFCGWTTSGGSLKWALNDPLRRIPSFPRFDHTSRMYKGRFVFAENHNSSYETALLSSPHMKVNASNSACLGFWYLTSRQHPVVKISVHSGSRILFNTGAAFNHHWNQALVDFKTGAERLQLGIRVRMRSGLIAVDDIRVSNGTCPQRDFCSWEPGSSCRIHQAKGTFPRWTRRCAVEIGVPDHTFQSLQGHYLYLNTTALESPYFTAKVVLQSRPRTKDTGVMFWWRGRGSESKLNVYMLTEPTGLGDPLFTATSRSEGDWWNVHLLHINSIRKWNLVFEVVAPLGARQESGVMIDDIEFADGTYQDFRACTFDHACLTLVALPASEGEAQFEVVRAGSFEKLPRDHTIRTGEGYYMLYKSTGSRRSNASLQLRQPSVYRCISLWYYLPTVSDGVKLYVGGKDVGEKQGTWTSVNSRLSSSMRPTITAVSGGNEDGFVAIDDVYSSEISCEDFVPETFNCSSNQTLPGERVCDFVADCENGADELHCGDCDFSEGSCGWFTKRVVGPSFWHRAIIGNVPVAAPTGADNRRIGHYALFYTNYTFVENVIARVIVAPTIRNTGNLCTLSFWYYYNIKGPPDCTMMVVMQVDGALNAIPIWQSNSWMAGEQLVWKEAILHIGRYYGMVTLAFVASQFNEGSSAFTLDIVRLQGCARTAGHGNCTSDDVHCSNGACVPEDSRCNYIDDCGDGSDEQDCDDSGLRCNFESSFCDWTPEPDTQNSANTWTLGRPSESLWLNPSRDHTTGTAQGQFIILKCAKTNGKSSFVGPVLKSSFPCSITFFYTMHGSSEPELTLNVRTTVDGPWIAVWKQTGQTEFVNFQPVTVNLNTSSPFQVSFTGKHTKPLYYGYIAIDDISFTEACEASSEALPRAPLRTTHAITCKDNEFNCAGSSECIAHDKVCDFNKHCANGADEAQCASARLVFGIVPPPKAYADYRNVVPLADLRRQPKAGTEWRSLAVMTGKWDAGARFFFEANTVGVRVHRVQYLDCHPDPKRMLWNISGNKTWYSSKPFASGWTPQHSRGLLHWIYFSGAAANTLEWLPEDTGGYMFATNTLHLGSFAELVSSTMQPAPQNGRCFTFWYNMWHPNSDGLVLFVRADGDESVIWMRAGPQGKDWHQGQVQLRYHVPHQLVFRAYLLAHIPASIAVNRFTMQDGECNTDKVCTFESGSCGWKLQNWELTTATKLEDLERDHSTETFAGHVALLKYPGGRMRSPNHWRSTSHQRCLRFWFFIHGSTAEMLNVTALRENGEEEHLWVGTTFQMATKEWKSAAVDLFSQGIIEIAFVGKTSGKFSAAVAVDDVSLEEEHCPPPGSCTFEQDTCNWQVMDREDVMRWYRHKGPTVSKSRGLENDHTLGTADGYYLLLDSNDMSAIPYGVLGSQTLTNGPIVCFSLYYRMEMEKGAVLNVTFIDMVNGLVTGSTSTASVTSPSGWTRLSVQRDDLPPRYIIFITATIGWAPSDVAIDDIDLRVGKCAELRALKDQQLTTVSPQVHGATRTLTASLVFILLPCVTAVIAAIIYRRRVAAQ